VPKNNSKYLEFFKKKSLAFCKTIRCTGFIGIVNDVVLFVVEAEITDKIIRIISARKANKSEREKYNGENSFS
jgi:uncharacterized DUF497 family protein